MKTKWTSEDVEATNKLGNVLFKLQLCIFNIMPAGLGQDHEYTLTTLLGSHIDWQHQVVKQEAFAHWHKLNKFEDEV